MQQLTETNIRTVLEEKFRESLIAIEQKSQNHYILTINNTSQEEISNYFKECFGGLWLITEATQGAYNVKFVLIPVADANQQAIDPNWNPVTWIDRFINFISAPVLKAIYKWRSTISKK